jgi:hypothetical protein
MNNPKKIDTKYEAFVAAVKIIFNKRNFYKFMLIMATLVIPLTIFLLKGGLDFILMVLGKGGTK